MNIIDSYESGNCDLEELIERLSGLTDDSLEAAVGYEKLVLSSFSVLLVVFT